MKTHEARRERLTDKRLETLTAPAGKRLDVADTIVRELRMRISDKGAKSWSVVYRIAGKGDEGRRGPMRRMTLGSYPLLSLEKARDKARAALDAADRGLDPAAARTEQLAHQKTQTFEAVLDRFIELHVKQNTKEGRFARDRAAVLTAAAEGKSVRVKGPKSKLGRSAAERIIADNALPVWRGRLSCASAQLSLPLRSVVLADAAYEENARGAENGENTPGDCDHVGDGE